MMTLQEIVRTSLSPQELDSLQAASKLWRKMRRGKHMNDWSTIRPHLGSGSRMAMRAAGTNRREGRLYNQIFGAFKQEYFPDIPAATVSHLLWLDDDPERLRILDRLLGSPRFAARISAPSTARKWVEWALRRAAKAEPETPLTDDQIKDVVAKLDEPEAAAPQPAPAPQPLPQPLSQPQVAVPGKPGPRPPETKPRDDPFDDGLYSLGSITHADDPGMDLPPIPDLPPRPERRKSRVPDAIDRDENGRWVNIEANILHHLTDGEWRDVTKMRDTLDDDKELPVEEVRKGFDAVRRLVDVRVDERPGARGAQYRITLQEQTIALAEIRDRLDPLIERFFAMSRRPLSHQTPGLLHSAGAELVAILREWSK